MVVEHKRPERKDPVHFPADQFGLEKLMCLRDISNYLGINYHTLKYHRISGHFPPPDVMISTRPRWKSSTIKSLVESGHIC